MISPFFYAFFLYALALISIGIISYKQARSSDEFLLANRSLSYWVTAISAHASDMSSWLFIGLPAALYDKGFTELWTPLGLLAGMWATWHYIAPRLRTKTEEYDVYTLSSFFSVVTKDTDGWVIRISGYATLFFFLFYIASGLKGIGTVLENVFSLSPLIGIPLAGSIVVIYTLLGGYVAVAMTDFFQGIFLLIMLLSVPLMVFFNLPAHHTAPHILHLITQKSTLFSYTDIPSYLLIGASWGLGYVGMPHVLTKFMGIDSVKEMKKAQYVGMSWQLLTLTAASITGLLSICFFAGQVIESESIFTHLTLNLFSPFIAGLVLCAILAATISTVDSQILVAATVIAKDFFGYLPSQTVLLISRLSIVGMTIGGAIIALFSHESLYFMVKYAWSGLGSTFGPLVISCLYDPVITRNGALCGMLTGALVSTLWPYLGIGMHDNPLIPGFLSGLIMITFVSRLTKRSF